MAILPYVSLLGIPYWVFITKQNIDITANRNGRYHLSDYLFAIGIKRVLATSMFSYSRKRFVNQTAGSESQRMISGSCVDHP